MTKVGDKKAARKFCGALRRAADPKAYEGLMYQLAGKLRRLPGKVLGVYQPIASEPDPMPAVRSWLSEGMNRTLASGGGACSRCCWYSCCSRTASDSRHSSGALPWVVGQAFSIGIWRRLF